MTTLKNAANDKYSTKKKQHMHMTQKYFIWQYNFQATSCCCTLNYEILRQMTFDSINSEHTV